MEMKYVATIHLDRKNNSHTLAYDMVQAHAQGRQLRVLEVGCASGYWGALLKAAGHGVVGIEPDPLAATEAQQVLDQVFVGGADDYFSASPDEKFDVISFVDVLEHTADPVGILVECRAHLKPGGVVVASIPNVAHLAVRTMLLAGRWDYAQTGVMDSSHVRFFTRNSVVDLFCTAAFQILDFQPTRLSAATVVRDYGIYSPIWLRVIAWAFAPDRTWRDFQYVVCASCGEMDQIDIAANQGFCERADFFLSTFFKMKSLSQWIVLKVKQLLTLGRRA